MQDFVRNFLPGHDPTHVAESEVEPLEQLLVETNDALDRALANLHKGVHTLASHSVPANGTPTRQEPSGTALLHHRHLPYRDCCGTTQAAAWVRTSCAKQ